MGLLGSALGRAMAGAGGAAASLAGKYIDEEIATRRAEFLAQLQRGNAEHAAGVQFDLAKRTEEYTQSPEVQGRRRDNATAATLAQGSATRQSELEGLNDAEYQGARRSKADQDAADATRRSVDDIKAKTPAEAERAWLIARAQQRAQSAGASQAVLDKVRQMEQVLGRTLTEEERLLAVGLASKPKDGADLVEVEEVVDSGDGNKVTRKWKEGKPKPPTLEVAHEQAQAAVAAGASRADVNARLKDMGHPPLPDAPKPQARPRLPSAPPTPADEISGASESALRRIIDMGDPRADLARAELRRREQRRTQVDIPVPGGA